MKLVDKMILFSRFLRENKKRKLDIDELLHENKSYFTEQSKFWKDKSSYENIDENLDNLINLSQQYNNTIDQIDTTTSNLLRDSELQVLRRDYDRYNKSENTLELKLLQRNSDQDWIKTIKNQIGQYSSWQYPGIELNPVDGTLTRSMLSCDPLYVYSGTIIDKDKIKNNFNDFFAEKRLLFYSNLDKLPQGQLGTAVSIHQYEFLPIDPIKDEMKQIYNILRPGGYFIFTFSDCEIEAQLDLLAGPGGYYSYNTKPLMISLVEMLGFEIVKTDVWREVQSYMVVKKPGDLQTQKKSAPLVQIIDKITSEKLKK